MNRKHFVLYDKHDVECDSIGLMILDEYIKDTRIKEGINQNYTFECMMLNDYAKHLPEGAIIKVPTRQGSELFRVRLIEQDMSDSGYTYIYCTQPFFCDMEDNLIVGLELNGVTGTTALTRMSESTEVPHNFTFYSDIDDEGYTFLSYQNFVTALIGDIDESFINSWGGELEVNNWTVKMNKRRGRDRGVKIRYRHNLTGLNVTKDYSTVVTRIYPISGDGITLDEKYVDSPLVDPLHPIIKKVNFDYVYLTEDGGEDGGFASEEEVKAELRKYAEAMFSVGNIDKPEETYQVEFDDVSRTREHYNLAILDTIFIGDTVEVEHEDMGVTVSTRCVDYEYDPKSDRYLSMTLGTVTGTFSNNTQKTQESILNKIENNKQTIQGKLDAAVDHLTSLIQAGVSGHVIITENEILIMDTTDPATAVEVWRFNSGGIGYSNTGYNGPFIGLTKDGKLVVNEATAHTLSASLMKTGLLQSADGKSWWNFDNGHFSWADGAFTFDGKQFEFKINGTNIVDTLDKSFTILASHENQVIPVTSDGNALDYGDYLFEFTVIRNYSGTEAPCMVTKITPSSKITGVSYRQNENTCSMVINKGVNLSANPDEYFDVELTILDHVLTKRITWCTVAQGADGIDGVAGQTLYTWMRYADDANGNGISNSPNGKAYIGLAYNKTTPNESNKPSDYSWSLMKGNDGLKGEDGKDGNPNYTWIKYSDYSNGKDMYNTPNEFTGYIGIAVNKDTPTEGTDPSEYTWSKFRGEDGVDGQPGATLYTWIKYADDAQGNGLSNSPDGKEYIGFAYNKTSPYETEQPGDYTWSLIKGSDGIPGTNGKDGKTYYTWIKYSDNSNGSSMYDTPKDSTKYIGIAVNQTTSTEGTNPSKYTWSKFRGNDGVAGPTHYTWIKYADDANGSGISNSPTGKAYIGFAYNKTTPTESSTPGDYTWSLIKGTDGVAGTNGKDGKTYYTWIKYSDNSNGSSMYDTPKSTTKYIGIAVNQTSSTEGTDPSKYTWSKFRGDDGVAGKTYYTWIKYADDASGNGLSDNPSGKEYIGFAYNKTSATESTTASDYTWSLIKGSDGVPGTNGKDGKTYYTWIKYSDNANGSGMYDTPKDSTKYIGIAVNQTSATESTDASKYTWSKFRGDDGVDGADGKDGVTQKHNLIKNSAFFKGSSGWKLESNTSLDYEFKYGDHPTVHIACSGVTDKVKWYGISSTTNLAITELKEGVKYIFSYMYYTPNVKEFDGNLTMTSSSTSAFNLNIAHIDTNGTTTYYGPSQQISGLVEGVWTKVTGSFIPKKTGKVGRVKFGLAANGEVWATDFKLEENTEASDWCGTADESIGQDGVDGQPGHDAQTASIVASSTVFKSTDGGVTFRPGSITLTPLYQNVSHSKWLYSTNNGSSWVTISNNGVSGITLNGQTVAVSYDCQLFTNSITTVQFKVISTNASVYDVITITKISERADLNDALATMEMTINQSNTAWQAAFKTSSANNLLKNSDAKFGTENWITNGGGLVVSKANVFPFYGKKEPYFKTSFPSGIKYTEDIILEPNTDYVYEGYVYVNGSIVPGNRTPLHFYCYTTNSGTIEACDIIDYRQNLVSGRFVKCYVHFKTKDVNSNIYFRAFVYSTSTVDHVGVKRLSLKKGDRETEWCQHPNEVATAAVTISENGLKATHSESDTYTLMNARGNAIYDVETGEAIAWMSAKEQWTEAKFDYVFAKNIVNCYVGAYTLYVDHSHTGASLGTSTNPFSSFADLKNHLPENTILTEDLYIYVRDPGFVIHEPLKLGRISGSGFIKIKLEGQQVIEGDGNHCIDLYQIHNWVWIEGVRQNVGSSTTGAVLSNSATSVSGAKCIHATDVDRLEVDRITMVNTSGCAIETERVDLYTYCCDFGNSNRAVWLKYQSQYFTSSDCGSCSVFVFLNSGSKAYWGHAGSPIRPMGDCNASNGIFYSFANCSTKASARYPGTSAPSAPSGQQNYTQTFENPTLQSYQHLYKSWSSDGSCKQGSWGYGKRGGHMFFDINAIRSFLSGTVLDGNTITLTRANSGGMNAASNVYICGSTCSSATGTPTYSNRTHVGTLTWGEKKTFALPLEIVQSLKTGTCSSVAVHVESDDKYDYINITAATMTLKCKK